MLVLIMQLILLDLHAFEGLDAQFDLEWEAFDVPRALADEVRELALHHSQHMLLETRKLATSLCVFAAILLVIFRYIWDRWA